MVRYEPNRGKGYAVRRGLLEAQANIALFSDADLSTPITEAPKLFEAIRNGECECSDYVRHGKGHPCKHRLALMLRDWLEVNCQQGEGASGEISR